MQDRLTAFARRHGGLHAETRGTATGVARFPRFSVLFLGLVI